MQVFCTKCGTKQEFATNPAGPVQCGACGHVFNVGVPAGGAPPPAGSPQQYQPPKPKSGGGATVAIVLAVAAIPCIGILAAIAIPNFIRFNVRSKQGECKANLKSMFTAQKSYFQEKDAYEVKLADVGFSPERGNRYAYFADEGGEIELRDGATPERHADDTAIAIDRFKHPASRHIDLEDLPERFAGDLLLGIDGKCPDCQFTGACAGNVDNDETLDVWSISTIERTAASGERIPAGVPFNDVNDVTD